MSKTVSDIQLRQNIRIIMDQEGWTIRGLALAARMHESTVQRMLAGKRYIRATELADLADVLNVSLAALLRSDLSEPRSEPSPDGRWRVG